MKTIITILLVVTVLGGLSSQATTDSAAEGERPNLGQMPPREAPSVPSDTVKVTYVGNAGMMVERAGKKILIDAVFGHGIAADGRCVAPSGDVLEKMEKALPPFDNVDLVAATHSHHDHFHPGSVVEHLRHNPRAVFVSTGQSLEKIKAECPDVADIQARLRCRTPGKGSFWEETINGIKIKAYGLTHSPPQTDIDNLGLLFEVQGFKVFHAGDTSWANRDEYARLGLQDEAIDLGLVHKGFFVWHKGRGQDVVEEFIRPKQIVLVHVYRDEMESLLKALPVYRQRFPRVDAIVQPMESRVLPGIGPSASSSTKDPMEALRSE